MQPNDATRKISLDPIGVMHSPFGEKFGTPRQAGLVDAAIGEVELFRPYSDPRMFAGLEGFSHLWLTFRFDRCVDQGWHARVRPPRLGGNVDVGVWASRAPFRPNHLGLSAVRLLEVLRGTETRLRVAGIDLIDGTPILDIKPYLPYADCIADACGGFAAEAPPARFDVVFSQAAERGLAGLGNADALRRLIVDVIALDPRPAYRRGAEPQRRYGMRLGDCDVVWRVLAEDRAEVIALTPVA